MGRHRPAHDTDHGAAARRPGRRGRRRDADRVHLAVQPDRPTGALDALRLRPERLADRPAARRAPVGRGAAPQSRASVRARDVVARATAELNTTVAIWAI